MEISVRQFIFLLILSIFLTEPIFADMDDFFFTPQRRRLMFVEDYYKLYRKNLYGDTAAYLANIYYLGLALKAAKRGMWDHPVRSNAYVRYDWGDQPYDEKQHAKYKEIMKMRIHLLLTKCYLQLGARYDKENIYWFNKEYYVALKKSFNIAETLYKHGYQHWKETKKYVKICWDQRHIDLKGPQMDQMEDEVYKIYHMADERYKRDVKDYYNKKNYPEYNYDKIIPEKIASLNHKRKKLDYYLTRFQKDESKK